MGEAIAAAIAWARDQGVTPWAMVWVACGYLLMRGLAKLGATLGQTAQGAWKRYDAMFTSLESQLAEARKELEQVKAERESLRRELDRADALVEVQRARLVPQHMREDNGN